MAPISAAHQREAQAEHPPVHSPSARVLSIRNLSKRFGGARALDGVSFDVIPGEVHGLLGKNGSGKSTLVKILAGFHAPDPGASLTFNGETVPLPLRSGDFRALGMSFVHQNLGLVPSLTVLENLRFAELGGKRGLWLDWRREREIAQEAMRRFGLDLDLGVRVDQLSAVQRALLAIVRAFEDIRIATAISGKPGLVLLDEPSPFLPAEGVQHLFELIRNIVKTGSSVIFISHDIEEVMAITDRATVLRDGKVAGQLVTSRATHDEFVELIVGSRLARQEGARHAERRTFPERIRLSEVRGKITEAVDIAIGKGEILGLTGLIGSGYDELPYLVFGAKKGVSGRISIDGGPEIALSGMTPRRAIESSFALLPGDRNGASGIGSLTILENMFLPDLERFTRNGVLRFGSMRVAARGLGTTYEVYPNDPDLNLSALSGGNAQKVLLARWMNRNPKLLLLDEPTQGVDVGTRAMIFEALRNAARNGMSIICASSDAEQLADICDRVLIYARGRVTRELTGQEITKSGIAEACYTSTRTDPSLVGH